MATTYIALTIGPIYGTIRKARRTRELWAASYLFSHLMKELCGTLKDKGTLLLPQFQDAPAGEKPGVGLYPDRLIMKANDGVELNEVMSEAAKVKKELVEAVMGDLRSTKLKGSVRAARIDEILRGNGAEAVNLRSFLNDYFRVFSIAAGQDELERITGLTGMEAVVKGCNRLLDNMELRPALPFHDSDAIQVFLSAADHSSFLRKAAFDSRVTRFPSLYEIGTHELRMRKEHNAFPLRAIYDRIVQEDLDDIGEFEEKDLYARLKNDREQGATLQNALTEFHRYGTYVHADGDNIGKLLGTLRSEEDLNQFSGQLAGFARDANTELAGSRFTGGDPDQPGLGAVPVYIGGDDLLLLAPVLTRAPNGDVISVYELVERLSARFTNQFKGAQEPTLSFGIHISYVKAPMREANDVAHGLLMAVKQDRYKLRDRLHLKITKHSGGSFSAVYYKGNAVKADFPGSKQQLSPWEMTLDLVGRLALPLPKGNGQTAKGGPFLNSLIAKVREQRTLLKAIGGDRQRIEAWFANNFDEPHHAGFHKGLFAELAAYISAGHAQAEHLAEHESVTVEKAFDEFLDCLYMTLRFIQFIRGHDRA